MGQPFTVTATVANTGPTAVEDVQVALRSPRTLDVHGGTTAQLGTLDGDAALEIEWDVSADRPGGYTIVAVVEASLDGHRFDSASTAHLVHVRPREPPRGPERPPVADT